jgi:hypothetical protein
LLWNWMTRAGKHFPSKLDTTMIDAQLADLVPSHVIVDRRGATDTVAAPI